MSSSCPLEKCIFYEKELSYILVLTYIYVCQNEDYIQRSYVILPLVMAIGVFLLQR